MSRDGNIPIYRHKPRWQPIEIELNNGHKQIAGYTLNPVWQVGKNNYQAGLGADSFEWQMGKREPCPECERILNKGWKS